MVRLGDGRIIRRHQDHLRIRKNDIEIVSDPEAEVATRKEAEVPSDTLLDTLIQPSTPSLETAESGGKSSDNPDNTEAESDSTGEPPTDHEVVVDTETLSPATSEGSYYSYAATNTFKENIPMQNVIDILQIGMMANILLNSDFFLFSVSCMNLIFFSFPDFFKGEGV